jgi:hypothetical protein
MRGRFGGKRSTPDPSLSRASERNEVGRKIARENARQKIWALEGYALKERLAGNWQVIGKVREWGFTRPVSVMP